MDTSFQRGGAAAVTANYLKLERGDDNRTRP
jgi:hypothetical protein